MKSAARAEPTYAQVRQIEAIDARAADLVVVIRQAVCAEKIADVVMQIAAAVKQAKAALTGG